MVELVKKYKKAVTLAIGDGANDVSMIKSKFLKNTDFHEEKQSSWRNTLEANDTLMSFYASEST